MAEDQLVLRGTMRGHTDWVTAIAAPINNSDMIVTSSRDKSLVVWSLTKEDPNYGVARSRLTGHGHFVQDVALSSDGRFALSGSWDGELRLWDIKTGATARRFVGHTKEVLSVAFSVDNLQFVSASRDKTIKVWNTLGECMYTSQSKKNHSDWVTCVRVSPNNPTPTIVSGSGDKTVKIWNLTNCQLKRTLFGHTGSVNTATLSPDGSLCASGGEDGVVLLWDIGLERKLYTFYARSVIHSVCFNPNRYWLCAATESSIKIWDLESKLLVMDLKVDLATEIAATTVTNKILHCTCLAWSADGSTLYSGYTDGVVRVWGKAERAARLSSRDERMARHLERCKEAKRGSQNPQPRCSSPLADHVEVEMSDTYVASSAPIRQVAPPPPEDCDQDLAPTQRNFKVRHNSRCSKRRISTYNDSPPARSPSPEYSRPPLDRAMLEQFEGIHLEDRRKIIPDRPVSDPTASRFSPSWAISENESMLHPSSDFVCGELMRGILFDHDKHEMMSADHHVVEDLTLEYMSKAALFAHNLSAKVSVHKQQLKDAQSTIAVERKKAEEAWQMLADERSKIYEERQNWGKERVVLERRAETLTEECNKAINDLAAAQQEQQSSYQRGYSTATKEVMSTFFASDGYRAIHSKARVSGARDFLKSTTFKDILEEKEADYIMEGFNKAVDYMVQDGFVTQNFNVIHFEDHRLGAPPLRISEVLEPTYEDMPEFYTLSGNTETPASDDVNVESGHLIVTSTVDFDANEHNVTLGNSSLEANTRAKTRKARRAK